MTPETFVVYILLGLALCFAIPIPYLLWKTVKHSTQDI